MTFTSIICDKNAFHPKFELENKLENETTDHSKWIYREGQLFGIGNPLLDITANVTDEFLEK